MLNHAQILGVKDISSALVLIYREILTRTLLLHNGIFPAAGMRTCSLVGISSGEKAAEQTSSRIGNTHRSVDKALDLKILWNMFTYLFNLGKRQFSRRHDTFCALLIPEPVGHIIRIIGLCRHMNINFRADFTCKGKHSRICNNQGIRL